MESFFENCIFCFKKLSNKERKGRGEHIIPGFLYGSMRFKDVCRQCNNRLGSIADSRALEDARVISAVTTLDLPSLSKRIIDRGTGVMIDPEDGSRLPVTFKDGIHRIVPHQPSRNLFISAEGEALKHLENRLSKDKRHGLSPEEITDLLNREIAPKFNALGAGESMEVPDMGIILSKKAGGAIERKYKITPRAAESLVAKIGYEIAFLVFDQDRILALSSLLDTLSATAFGHGELDQTMLVYPLRRHSYITKANKSDYHHQIIVWCQTNSPVFIDVYLFANVGFRLVLHAPHHEARGPIMVQDSPIEMVSFLMTFLPNCPPGKFVHVKRATHDEIDEWECP